MSTQKKMFKVYSPIDKKGGGTYWMRLGTAFTNRDDSLNLYLDAIPPTNPKSNRYELHVREFTEEDHRRRESYSSGARNSGSSGGNAGTVGGGSAGSYASRDVADYARDDDFHLPSVGDPTASSRAVTAMGSTGSERDTPF